MNLRGCCYIAPHLPVNGLRRKNQAFYSKCEYWLGCCLWKWWSSNGSFDWWVLFACWLLDGSSPELHSSGKTLMLWWLCNFIFHIFTIHKVQLHHCIWLKSTLPYIRLVFANQHNYLHSSFLWNDHWPIHLKWRLCEQDPHSTRNWQCSSTHAQ